MTDGNSDDSRNNGCILLIHPERRSTSEDEHPKLILNQENLTLLLEQVGDRHLSIYCLAGPQKTGKSLLFGYMVKYLIAAENDNPDWIDWTATDKSLTEFQWSSQTGKNKSPDTPGIWCFNRPFILKPEEDTGRKEVAVLLLYVQASDWTQEDSPMMGLAMASSGLTFYNVQHTLTEKYVSALADQVKWAIHGIRGSTNKKTEEKTSRFGEVMFVVRDWKFPKEYPFGIPAGEKFVKEKLQEKPDHSKEARLNRELIKAMFQNVSGCLLPFPGMTVMKSEFQGRIDQMEELFVQKLDHFMKEVINLDEMGSGDDNGHEKIGGHQWKELLECYINVVNSGRGLGNQITTDILTTAGVKDTMLEEEKMEMMKKAMKIYGDAWKGLARERTEMKERELKDIHKRAKKRAVDEFKKAIGSDGEDDENGKPCMKIEDHLKTRLEEKFQEMKKQNERFQKDSLERWKVQMVEHYMQVMETAFPSNGHHSIPSRTAVLRESKEVIRNLLADFARKKGHESDRFGEQLKKAEETLLERIFKIRGSGDGHEWEPSKDSGMNSSTMSQSSHLGSLETVVCSTPPAFDSLRLEESRSASNGVYNWNMSASYNDFAGVTGSLVAAKTRASTKKMEEGRRKQAAALIDKLTKGYVSKLQGDQVEDDDLEIRTIQEKFAKEALFSEDSQELKLYQEMLVAELKKARSSLTLKRNQLSASQQQDFNQAIKEGLSRYHSKLEKFVQDTPNITPSQLEKESNNYLKEELDIISKKFSGGKGHDLGKIKEELARKIGQVFQQVKKDTEDNKVMSVERTMSLFNGCRQEYSDMMKISMANVENDEDLAKEDKKARRKVIDDLKKNAEVSGILVDKHIQSLESCLDRTFKDLKSRFRMKLDGEAALSQLDVSKSRTFYVEEMEKHLKNHEFISPAELVKLHEEVLEAALNTVGNVDEGQMEELREKLQLAFQRFEDENTMNMDGEPVIGIDLGTTFSCVAVYQRGEVKIIPNSMEKLTTPSYVLIQPSGEEIVGEEAKTRAYENPEGTIFDAKRILGRSFDDEKLQDDMKLWPFNVVDGGHGIPKIAVNGNRLNPEEISAKILTRLKKDAEAFLKRKIKKAVITVPAYFTDGQKQATIDAGRMAGLEVLSTLKEPVAAAMAYKLQYALDTERHILIFDLGGGTFDVAVLKTNKGKIEVLTVDGDTHLGGEDFDQNLMIYCAEEFKNKHKIDLFRGKDSPIKRSRDEARQRLKRLQGECERQKILLTDTRSATVSVKRIFNELELSVKVTRQTFDQINDDLFQKTIRVVDKALHNAELEKDQIDDIVLVGGSTRIPKIQKLLQTYFGGKSLDHKINPDEAVAHGAGLFAAIMKGDVTTDSAAFAKIQDITAMPIGVEVYGGGFSEIIPKSTKTPVKLQEKYKTAHNNQTSVQITIYEGEDPIAVNNKKLGDFYLNGIPPKGAGEENIEVEMDVNDQCILHVTAKCNSNGKSKRIPVMENKQRMGEAEIIRYLAEANHD